MGQPRTTYWSHKKITTRRGQRRIEESGVSSIRVWLTTQVSVGSSSHWWSSWRLHNHLHVLNWSQNSTRGMAKGSRSFMHSSVPLLPLPRSKRMSPKIQRRGGIFSTHKCGWRVHHWNSLLSGSQKNLISAKVVKWLGLPTIAKRTRSRTVLGGFTNDKISESASSATFPTTSSPSHMRYCLMLHLWMFVMYY